MFPFIACSSLLLTVLQPTVTIFVTIPGNGTASVCLSQESRNTVIQNITATVQTILQGFTTSQNCGAGQWYQVAYLNMSNPAQQCPSAWREYNTQSGVRVCGRPVSRSKLSSYILSCGHGSSVQPGVWESHWLSVWNYRWIWFPGTGTTT